MKEKRHQVRQIRLIYENAENVLIWLGPSSQDIDLLMKFTNRLEKRAIARSDNRRSSPKPWQIEWPILLDELRGIHTDFNSRRLNALKLLLERPWFRRV
jgi:hypothetical protein